VNDASGVSHTSETNGTGENGKEGGMKSLDEGVLILSAAAEQTRSARPNGAITFLSPMLQDASTPRIMKQCWTDLHAN
jgi:hypothetical protein